MADGGNLPIKARVICPYFLRFTLERRAIVCEGMVEGVQSATMFRRREDLEKYSEKFCETYKFNRCPIARACALKYQDESGR